jgi:hypothetical protein
MAVRIPMPAKTDEGKAMAGAMWRQGFDGLAYLWRRPTLLGLTLVVSTTTFLMGALGVLILPYPLARTHSTLAFGVVLASADVGMIVGSAAMAAWGGTRPRVHTVMLALLLAGLLLAAAGAARTTAELALAFFAFMIMPPFVNTASTSIFQAKVAPDVQARVFAAKGQIATLTTPLALLLAGPFVDRVLEPAALAWLAGGRLAGRPPRRCGDGPAAVDRRAGDRRARARRLYAAGPAAARDHPARSPRHAGRGCDVWKRRWLTTRQPPGEGATGWVSQGCNRAADRLIPPVGRLHRSLTQLLRACALMATSGRTQPEGIVASRALT